MPHPDAQVQVCVSGVCAVIVRYLLSPQINPSHGAPLAAFA